MNPVDWKVRSGMLQKFFPVTFPTITGRDGAGEVIGAAAGADASLIGKRVCFMAQRGAGTWSQKVALQASLAVPIPPSMSYEQAASLPLASVSAWSWVGADRGCEAGNARVDTCRCRRCR